MLSIYEAALSAVNGGRCVSAALQQDTHLMGNGEDIVLIAIGKAAVSMAQGAIQVLGQRITRGLVITKTGYANTLDSRIKVIESSHPLPDHLSLQAGQQLLTFIAGLNVSSRVIFLLSGGASSLVEVLPEQVSIEDLRQLNAWMLAHEFEIGEINTVRKRCSCIKGGRLARYLTGHQVTCLAISDVVGDDPRVIGSGMLSADPALQRAVTVALPKDIARLITLAPSAPEPGDSCFANIRYQVIANLEMAKQAARVRAEELGYAVVVSPRFIQGNAVAQGGKLAAELVQCVNRDDTSDSRRVMIWGGETIVQLPEQPGRGGRCQSLALSAAIRLQNNPHVVLLAAGTDGSDGPGMDAGAVIDGETIQRGEAVLSRHADEFLQHADAGSFLQASGDLIRTGPTGTNVMDLIIGIYYA